MTDAVRAPSGFCVQVAWGEGGLAAQPEPELADVLGLPQGTKVLEWQAPQVRMGVAPSLAGTVYLAAGEEDLALAGRIRLDNRDEVRALLGRAVTDCANEAELCLAAYRRWGEDCARQLRGDFSFVVWSHRQQQLAVIRDVVGTVPIFYWRRAGQLLVASDVAMVVAMSTRSPTLSPLALAHYLGRGELYDPALSFYRGIQRVPAATLLRFTQREELARRYWSPVEVARNNSTAIEPAAEQLRAVLEGAVARRLPQELPVAAHLTGGLDSSAVVALAQQQHEQFSAWSWLRPPADEAERCGEWRPGLMLAQHCNLKPRWVGCSAQDLLSMMASNPLGYGDSCDVWMEYPLRRQLHTTQTAVLLSGWGGDQFISHPGSQRYFESFWYRGQVLAILREFAGMATAHAVPPRRFLALLYHKLLRPALPVLGGYHFLQFATRELKALALAESLDGPTWYRGNCIRTEQLHNATWEHVQNRVESWAVAGARQDLEYRYPLLDQRVIELALSLPPECYRTRGVGRAVFRSAVSPLLPAGIVSGNFKHEPVRVAETARALGQAMLHWRERHSGQHSHWIDVPALHAWIEQLAGKDFSLEDRHLMLGGMAAIRAILVLELEAGL